MAASVTVGFAPAASPMVTAGVTAKPEGEDGGEAGLFAALLALLNPQPVETAVESPVPVGPADASAATLSVPLVDPANLPDAAAATTTATGKSLLKDLGDALIAINDALEAGQPVDPPLEKKLSESLDAIATYLGTLLPPTPAIDPQISALASGEGILPATPDTTPPPAAEPAIPAPAAAPASDTPTSSVADFATAIPAPGANAAAAASPAANSTAATSVAPTTTADKPAAPSPPLAQLAQLIDEIGGKLEAQSPHLAERLEVLAAALESGTVPSDLAAELGASDAASDPEIARIVEALSEPRPRAVAAPLQPFTAPTLELPEAVAGNANVEPAAPSLAAPPPDLAELVSTAPDAGAAKPAITQRLAAETASAEPDRKPAETASTAANSTPATAPDAQPSAPQVQTAPVARTVHAAYQTPVQQLNLPQVAFEVVRQFEAGNTRFQIRLDPPELGRIDVRLDVDKTGTVNARMTVERPETLDLMQRDQRALQQALQQAGLDANKTNLEFSLRQNPFAQQGGMGDGRGNQPGFAGPAGTSGDNDAPAELAATTYRGTASAGGVNLFV